MRKKVERSVIAWEMIGKKNTCQSSNYLHISVRDPAASKTKAWVTPWKVF